MSDMKHTPGPWVACQDPDAYSSDDWCIGTGKKEIDEIAVCGAANARLIAAAPELLEAIQEILASAVHAAKESDESLKKMLDEPECPDEAKLQINALLKARAAVAKATGEKS